MGLFILLSMLVGLIAIVIWGIIIYNNLVSLKNEAKKNWSNIDVLLKQRHDELPKLIATCKRYMEHESETFKAITEARSKVSSAREKQAMGDLGVAETALRVGLGQLFAVVENYPELKANQSFAKLQTRITSLENMIADRREFYNESVTINNTTIEQFPDVIIAKRYRFKAFELLEFSEDEIKDIDVSAHF